MDRLRDSSTCAFFECDGERCGSTGTSKPGGVAGGERGPGIDITGGFTSKNDLTSSIGGVVGVMGEESIEDVSVPELFRKLRSIVEKSESLPECIDEPEDPEILRISGAVKAWTFVVEISSVGREIRWRLMVPGAYLTLVPRTGT